MFRHCFLIVLSLCLCSSSGQLNVKLNQTLKNEGFHRNLTYQVTFEIEHDMESLLYNDCTIGIDQTIPPEVYTNPDELSDLLGGNKVDPVTKQKLNIDLSAELSAPSSVFVVRVVMASAADLWLPLHARYHRAESGGGMARNIIEPPKLYLRCPDNRLESCYQSDTFEVKLRCNGNTMEKCSWISIPYTLISDTVTWDVPVADTRQFYLVAVVTALVTTFFGLLYLLKAIRDNKLIFLKKKQ